MKCSILRDNYKNEVNSFYYQKLLETNSPEEALDKIFQGMIYAAVNNGTYVAKSNREAREIKSELTEYFPDTIILKGLNTYTVHIPRPKELTDEFLEEMNAMETVKSSSAYRQDIGDMANEKAVIVDKNDPDAPAEISRRFSATRNKFQFVDGKIKMTEGEEDDITKKKKLQYTLSDGTVIEHRVSDKASNKFRRNKSPEALAKMEKASEPNRLIGDAAHKVMEDSLGYYASKSTVTESVTTEGKVDSFGELGSNPKFTKAHNTILQEGAKSLFTYIEDTQKKINEYTGNDKPAQVYLENLVHDSIKDLAGSIDVLVVYSDGSTSIYDYKFTSMKTSRKGEVIQQWINHGKEESYNMQIGEYKRILKTFYGVNNFRESRIIPAHIGIDNSVELEVSSEIERLSKIVIMDRSVSQTLPIPVAGEQSKDKYTQSLVSTNRKRIEELNNEIKGLYAIEDDSDAKERKGLEVIALKLTNQALLVNNDFVPMLDDLQRMINELDDTLETMNLGKLREFSENLTVYGRVIPNVIGSVNPDKISKAMSINYKISNYIDQIHEEIKKRSTGDSEVDLQTPDKEIGFVTQYFSNLSMLKHPIFKKFRTLTKNMFQTILDKTRVLGEEAEEIREVAQGWADKNGKTIMEAYQLLIDPDSGGLVEEFNSEFYAAQKEAREKKSHKFFRDNYTYTGKDKYAKDLERYKKTLSSFYGEDTKIYKNQVKHWESQNSLAIGDVWINNPLAVYKYATKKISEKWNNTQYVYVQSQPELKRLYGWLVSKNREFNDTVNQKVDDTFVANIQKGFVQTISSDKNILSAFRDQGRKLHQSVMVRQNDLINQEDNKIPLLYYDNFQFKTKTGFAEVRASRSEDLIYNTMLFGNQVYLNQERHRIEDRVQGLRILLKNTPAIKTDWKGKIDMKDGEMKMLDFDAKSLDAFDAMLGNYVYGKSLRSKDRVFSVGEKMYSSNKILLKLMSYMSLKSLAGNYISGLGNLGGAYLNSFIKGVGGKYYTSNQLLKAHKVLIRRSDDDAWNRLTEYFNVEKDFWAKEKADKLSATALTRNLTYEKWYILQQKGDEFVANSVLLAMMQNYGLDSNKEIQLMEDLPEDSKSLFDSYTVVNDKVVIEGLDRAAFMDFRNRVKYVSRSIKGTNTTEDISVIQTEIWGRSIMHFRNWIAPMVKERFGNLTYTEEVKQWEIGRYKALANKMNQNFVKSGLEVLKGIVLLKKVGLNSDVAQSTVDIYNSENNTKLTVEKYIAAHEQQLQSAVAEFRIIAILVGILASLGWTDDDDEKFYSKFTGGRHMLRIMNRIHNEMTFFSSPTSVKEILKSPLPVMRVIEDGISVISNTFDEATDILFGEDARDSTPPGSATSKLFPILPWAVDVLSDFREED